MATSEIGALALKAANPHMPIPRKVEPGKTRGFHARIQTGDMLTGLPARALNSAATRSLGTLQRSANQVMQLDDEEEGLGAEPKKTTMIVSMDGDKIGSIYYGDGRIRTTHRSGPEDSRGKQKNIKRFNIDRSTAYKAYKKDKKARKTTAKKFNHYIRDELSSSKPGWAISEITDPESAPTDAPEDGKLFEFYDKAKGKRATHPSRGAGVKIEEDTANFEAVEGAMTHLKSVETSKTSGSLSATQKNQIFFAYLVGHAPAFSLKVRMPEEVDAMIAREAFKEAEDWVGDDDEQVEIWAEECIEAADRAAKSEYRQDETLAAPPEVMMELIDREFAAFIDAWDVKQKAQELLDDLK